MIFLAISSSSLKPKNVQNVVFARENKVFDDSGLPVGGIWVWSCPIWFVMFWPQATATSHKPRATRHSHTSHKPQATLFSFGRASQISFG